MEFTAELAATSLRYQGLAWRGDVITYSIPRAGSTWPSYAPGSEPETDYATLSPVQADAFRRVMSLYDEIIAPRIQDVDDLAGPGQIRVAISSLPSGAWANLPPGNQQEMPWHGDVWFDTADTDPNAFKDLLHEVGHALGLKHPRDEPNPMPVEFQLLRLSNMGGSAGDFGILAITVDRNGSEGTRVGARTPMVGDIAALQATYGADSATRAGDTTYTWDPSDPFLEAVYDAGGVDTYDLSTHVRRSLVDLTPGGYSSIGIWTRAEQEAFFKSAYPDFNWVGWFHPDDMLYTYERNLGTAFSTTIENVLAGAGDDTVIGNAAGNLVSGAAGGDVIFGHGGGDSLSGGEGSDYLRGGEGDDSLAGGGGFDDMQGNTGQDTLVGGDGGDWVLGGQGDDRVSGQAGDDIINGNLGYDVCDGGDGDDVVRGGQGDDILHGDAGVDWLSGDRGNDTLSGGAGADIFHSSATAGLDLVTDFSRADGDRIQLDAGTAYSLRQQGGDTVIDMGGDNRLVLVGVTASNLPPGTIFLA
ncbi:hypothetical protein LJR219_003220 [Phenylobacterium sp. LjRoot219]|uniref:hypothetical protein n=1 Tax=Phenylobacterium sp. LjRoot219 TaxID=3342283 RepID=UPI003ED114C9